MRTIRDEDRFRSDDETVSFEDVRAIQETDRALLVELDGEEKWIPKSVIHDDSEVWTMRGDEDEGREGKLIVKGWWARKEGLE